MRFTALVLVLLAASPLLATKRPYDIEPRMLLASIGRALQSKYAISGNQWNPKWTLAEAVDPALLNGGHVQHFNFGMKLKTLSPLAIAVAYVPTSPYQPPRAGALFQLDSTYPNEIDAVTGVFDDDFESYTFPWKADTVWLDRYDAKMYPVWRSQLIGGLLPLILAAGLALFLGIVAIRSTGWNWLQKFAFWTLVTGGLDSLVLAFSLVVLHGLVFGSEAVYLSRLFDYVIYAFVAAAIVTGFGLLLGLPLFFVSSHGAAVGKPSA